MIVNTSNNKIYVGSSKNLRQRKWDHFKLLNKNTHPNPHLQNAWNKHGYACFEFIVLTTCELSDILDIEQQYIDSLQPHLRDIGYNISPTAYSTLGTKWSEARHELGTPWLKGTKLSAEHKNKIGNALRGEASSFHKLTENQVIEIRKPENACFTNKELASTFNVSRDTIRLIRNNKIWKHL